MRIPRRAALMRRSHRVETYRVYAGPHQTVRLTISPQAGLRPGQEVRQFLLPGGMIVLRPEPLDGDGPRA